MSFRKALIIGVNHYEEAKSLTGAVNDATEVSKLFYRNDDGSLNYGCLPILGTEKKPLKKLYFRQYIHKLFTEATSSDELLFYFSGHGGQSAFGGYLLASDGTKWDPGISTNELITMANKCKAQQIVLIIDCCNSGQLGDIDILQAEKFQKAIIREGIAILAASTASQEAQEVKSHGRFTSVLIEGLKNATDLLGRVTMDTLYTYLKAYFGAWDQRPVFKSYTIDTFILRQGKARISPILIKYMMSLFKNKGDQYKVNKSFDNFQNPKANPDNVRTYKTILMPLRDAGLIEPVNAPSLWNSLYKETAVRLTSLGQYIWQLRKNGTI